ncbi:hypothetical protein ACFXKC_45640 [Streptomyces sp. NPDC059340]|uniref:hypothetical protein n=1 Tax=Streptomyces sp. NPDC059340 TaxID=3346806 RepID=UPI0036B0200D
MIQFLSGAGTTILSAVLTWCVATATRKRADAKADRATVRAQADALILAVSEVRAIASTNKVLWGSWKESARSAFLAALAFVGGAARTAAVATRDDRGEWLAIAAGLGAAVDTIGRDRREAKRMDGVLMPAMAQVMAAAAPLLRHPDPGVAAATERLFAAISDIEATEALDTALRGFGRAVVPVTTAPPSRWQRLRRGRRAIGSAGDSGTSS